MTEEKIPGRYALPLGSDVTGCFGVVAVLSSSACPT